MSQASSTKSIYLLDYGAGNVRSVVNAVESQGFSLKVITEPSDFDRASVSDFDRASVSHCDFDRASVHYKYFEFYHFL